MKAKIVRDSDGLFYGIRWTCPGCKLLGSSSGAHILPVNWLPPGETKESPAAAGAPHWSFNGDLANPVFGPSVLSSFGEHKRCHSFVGCNGAQPGQITFLSDCTHALAGKTVDLPEIEP